MPKIDLTVTISVIIALCAIISPILTCLINNRHQLTIRQLESEQKRYESTTIYLRSIFENYLRAAGKCVGRANSDALREYGEYYLVALMYAPDDIKHKMIHAHELMESYQWSDASKCYEELAPMIYLMLQNT